MPASPRFWKRRGTTAAFLFPLSLIFATLAALRRLAYRIGMLGATKLPVPVIVVGNIAVGGSGKTPVVLWLVERLVEAGRHPLIVSRGYGGRQAGPFAVAPDTDPLESGDEPVLLARRAGCPVWIGRDRVAVARAALAAHPECDVVVTDDGLQHYRLARDVEIAVVDPEVLGNGWLLPSGPLREPLSRLARCALVLAHGELPAALRARCGTAPVHAMSLAPGALYRLGDPLCRRAAGEFAALRLRAIAGIGRPERFFATLRAQGLAPASCKAFPDHHAFGPADVALEDADALVVTEKDAVKLQSFAPEQCWVLPVDARIGEGAFDTILERLDGCQTA